MSFFSAAKGFFQEASICPLKNATILLATGLCACGITYLGFAWTVSLRNAGEFKNYSESEKDSVGGFGIILLLIGLYGAVCILFSLTVFSSSIYRHLRNRRLLR